MKKQKQKLTYQKAGVDIERGERFVEIIKSINSPVIDRGIGAFSSIFAIDTKKYRNPVILSTTDGVGTKILVARTLNNFKTIGIDLVAMCVNDLLASGGFPVSFLDYIACGKINMGILKDTIEGIVRGCEIAECNLSGGETAEMPDMYEKNAFDLAGFAIGIAERGELLPKKEQIIKGDAILGLESNGIHSNGLSLARKAIPEGETETLKELLKPTRIYTREMKFLIKTGKILAAAHITGGGLEANIKRILPSNLRPVLNRKWEIPGIFKIIQEYGEIETEEMFRVFNMGIGMAIIVHESDRKTLKERAIKHNIKLIDIGMIENG